MKKMTMSVAREPSMEYFEPARGNEIKLAHQPDVQLHSGQYL